MSPKKAKPAKIDTPDEAIERLNDPDELTNREARQIAMVFKNSLKAMWLNEEWNNRDFRRLKRVLDANAGRDDGILEDFLRRIKRKLRHVRTPEEERSLKEDIANLGDGDVPDENDIQTIREERRERRREERERQRAKEERRARGGPQDPREIPVSLESMVSDLSQVTGSGDVPEHPRRRGRRDRERKK